MRLNNIKLYEIFRECNEGIICILNSRDAIRYDVVLVVLVKTQDKTEEEEKDYYSKSQIEMKSNRCFEDLVALFLFFYLFTSGYDH